MKKQKRDESGKFISSKKNSQVGKILSKSSEQLRKEDIKLNTKNNSQGVCSNAKLGMCLDGSEVGSCGSQKISVIIDSKGIRRLKLSGTFNAEYLLDDVRLGLMAFGLKQAFNKSNKFHNPVFNSESKDTDPYTFFTSY